MKRIKVYLTAIVTTVILAISSQVYAYGSQVDSANVITMPTSLSNGTGSVATSLSGSMSYQFVEISSAKYATIKKYEAIYNLINAYINGSSNYDSLATSYENTYNQTANGIMTEYGIQFNEEGLNAIKGLWISELTTYDASAWVVANGYSFSMDLTKFEGTKYFIAWVRVGDTYDAEVYKITGTGSNGSNDQNTDNNEEGKNSNNGETKTNGDSTDKTIKSDVTTANQTKLPKTGINAYMLTATGIAMLSAVVSFIKYRRIK